MALIAALGAGGVTVWVLRGNPNAGFARPIAGGPAGFTAYRSTADHFTVDVPDNWQVADPTSPQSQALLKEIEQLNPAMRSSLVTGATDLVKAGMALLAVNSVEDADGVTSNFSLIAHRYGTVTTGDLSEYAAALPSIAGQLGGMVTATAFLTFDGHQALSDTLAIPTTTPLGSLTTVQETQYMVGANGFLYVLTLTGSDPSLGTIAATFSSY